MTNKNIFIFLLLCLVSMLGYSVGDSNANDHEIIPLESDSPTYILKERGRTLFCQSSICYAITRKYNPVSPDF